MMLLDASITNVARNREFSMIEARVTFLAKQHSGQPPGPVSILTHVPLRGTIPLRDRLIADAARLLRARTVPQMQSVAA